MDLWITPPDQIVRAVVLVIETECPVHKTDVLTRVAGMWDLKLGSRIQARLLAACQSAERNGMVESRGDFYWSRSALGRCTVRSRAQTGISGDRIAPEEYDEAIMAVLARGHAFPRAQLTNEVRSVFGFNRTGTLLDAAIGGAIDRLLGQGKLGECSGGIRLRT
jgi:hypothetical protein